MFEAHFQSFEDRGERGAGAPRVAALRAELARRGLDGLIVPRADRFQNEYVPPCAERLAWLTGFTGSAGVAIVLADRAVIFVDGRYQVQVGEEVDPAIFSVEHLVERPPPAWIEANLPAGKKLGYSPWLHTVDGAERLAKACAAAGASLVAAADNPIDAHLARPAAAAARRRRAARSAFFRRGRATKTRAHPRRDAGKLAADALVVSDPHAVSWLFNIRGSDIPHTPVVLAFAMVPKEGRPALYIDGRKLGDDVRHRIEELAAVRAPADFERDLAVLGSEQRAVRLDPAACPEAIARLIAENGGKIMRGSDPIAPMKAVKNAVEIAGARAAQQRDGAAVTRFLAWFDREAPAGRLTEIDAVEALESFRRDTGLLKDVSFPTIAGAGPDGAIVHYRVTRKSNRRIAPGRAFFGRFRRPIRGRHHRHHPHRRGRDAEPPNLPKISRSCSKAISPSRGRCFPTAPPVRSSIHSRGSFSGGPASISITAPATASAAISRCTRDRRASPSSAARRSSAA